jgi:glycosyltransferase involved in cell wall biosynthesis
VTSAADVAPRVSVVIPNHNYAEFVGQAIDSVLAQTYRDFELIVVNNGSRDNSLDVLHAYGGRIRLFDQEDRGQAGARNRGIEESCGELIAFLDADDVWEPTKLEKQVPLFDDPSVGLVYCGHCVTDQDLNVLEVHLPTHRGRLLRRFADVSATIIGGESTAVIRKRCFDELGNFDPRLSISAGWDMYRRICSRYKVEVVTEPLMLYRQHGSNAHLRVTVYEQDVLLRLKKMFADPLSAELMPLKAQAYGRAYLALSGSYLHQGNWRKCLNYAAQALITWPPSLAYLLSTPWRTAARRSVGASV